MQLNQQEVKQAARNLSLLRKVRVRECAHCGVSFEYRDPRARYCSRQCQGKAAYLRRKS